ncbi:hypothetical protein [Desulfosporosinus youngiae]|uniref:Uncharacterized protein n=1 Tax=Desulfosporosinus youngiae DSM 17734 TaxID=768710 RepID=H5Y1X4_9FIRM|nr:hypothetical protein [Desulfosporosinus youngiae]EHQ88025.1 hypothetical protein DesyoDRAFT_0853 [Desulfosporosinus youngiae DSM 17734]
MGFIQLVLLEGVLLLSAGMIFFGGIRGTVAAMAALSGINYLTHDLAQFWRWEIPLLVGGSAGIILLLIVGRIGNKSKAVGGLVGGLTSLVFFGAFVTPIIAVALWALVFGTGIIPKSEKKQVIWGFAPAILRMVLGIGWIIYGNFLTI